MTRSRITVQQLASEAEIDVDDVLITLWDNSIDVNSPSSTIPKRNANQARRIVGIATRREMSSPKFWKKALRLGDIEFELLLQQLAIPPDAAAKRLTKKSINKLRAELRRRGIELDNDRGTFEPVTSRNGAPKVNAQTSKAVKFPAEPFVEQTIGKPKEIRYMGYQTVLSIHNQLVEDFAEHHDPIDPPGVRESGHLLESAILRPQTSLEGIRKYPSLEMASAALMHSLVHNHPFHNGNKRIALVATLVFLDQNGLLLICPEDDLFKLVLKVAQHSIVPSRLKDRLPDREVQEIAKWIRGNSRVIESSERPVPFRRMRKILGRCGCEISPVKGYHVEITRTLPATKGIFGTRKAPTVLSTGIAYSDEGREVSKDTIAKVRRDLHLDELNGWDSASFYDNAPECADGFIAKYRKILRRLAHL